MHFHKYKECAQWFEFGFISLAHITIQMKVVSDPLPESYLLLCNYS